MKNKFRRNVLSVLIFASIIISLIMNNVKGFGCSIILVVGALAALYGFRIHEIEYVGDNNRAKPTRMVTSEEQFGAAINVMLSIVWFFAELNCIYNFIG